jgi:hypothetical protein
MCDSFHRWVCGVVACLGYHNAIVVAGYFSQGMDTARWQAGRIQLINERENYD